MQFILGLFFSLIIFQLSELRGQTHPFLFNISDYNLGTVSNPNSPLHPIWITVKNYADTIVAEPLPPVPLPSDADLDYFRNSANALLPLAFTSHITGDTLYINRAREHLMIFAGWERWDLINNSSNPDSSIVDLATAHMVMMNAISFDWLYNYLSQSEKDSIINSLSYHAVRLYNAAVSTYNPFWNNWWRKSYVQNHIGINYSALGIAALALSSHNSNTSTWLNLVVDRLSRLKFLLDGIDDGSWHEGHNYQLYLFSLTIPVLYNLKIIQNQDLIPKNYFDNFIKWRLFNILPGTKEWFISYGDYEKSWGDNWSLNIFRFIASSNQNSYAQWMADRTVLYGPRRPTIWSAPYSVLECFYYDTTLIAQNPDGLKSEASFPDMNGIVWKTGWNNQALKFALHASPYGGRFVFDTFTASPRIYPWEEGGNELNFSHSHDDALTFYIFNKGAWLADEVVSRNKSTAYHNSILIDDIGQYRVPDSLSFSQTAFLDTDPAPLYSLHTEIFNFLNVDATNSYSKHSDLNDVNKVSRAVFFAKPDYFLMIDNLKSITPRKYTWICHFAQNVSIEGNWVKGAGTNNQVLGVNVLSPVQNTFTIGNDGLPFVHVSNSSNVSEMRFINLLFPTDETLWNHKPAAEIISDDGYTAIVKVDLSEQFEREDFIIAQYDSSEPSRLSDNFAFDGSIAYYSKSISGYPLKLSLFEGTYLADLQAGIELINVIDPFSPIEVIFSQDTCYISGSFRGTFLLYAPVTSVVLLNDDIQSFKRAGIHIIINPEYAPSAAFDIDINSGEIPLSVKFADESIYGSHPIISWEWDFNDDGIIDAADPGPHSYVYETEGIYSVKLKVSDGYLYDISYRDKLIHAYTASVVNVNEGWNIISIPVTPSDHSVSSLFPSATSNAFTFNNGYVAKDSLYNGIGYWLKFNSAGSIEINGARVSNDTIFVNEGWNMIGPFHYLINISSIETSPPGIISSRFFGFSHGYTSDTTLHIGKGYWVKASDAGRLFVSEANQNPVKYSSHLLSSSSEGSLKFTDASGSQRTLEFLNSTPDNFSLYELPPSPPFGIFDVRFASNRFAEVITSDELKLFLNSADYPVTIKAEGVTLKIKDSFNGEFINILLKKGSQLIINDSKIISLSVQIINIPEEFILYQNYPNPFNPETTIRFGLPEASKVNLSVYNILGEKVAEILNGKTDAGFHEVMFNARQLASGVYFYRLQADKHSSIRKMIILK